MLDLLRRREMPPTGRELGDARHVWEGDDAAVLGVAAELALSLERGACYGAVCGGRLASRQARPRARV
jgi:hypothetical protein